MASGWSRAVGNARSFVGNALGGLRGGHSLASWAVAGTLAYFLWVRPSQQLRREQEVNKFHFFRNSFTSFFCGLSFVIWIWFFLFTGKGGVGSGVRSLSIRWKEKTDSGSSSIFIMNFVFSCEVLTLMELGTNVNLGFVSQETGLVYGNKNQAKKSE